MDPILFPTYGRNASCLVEIHQEVEEGDHELQGQVEVIFIQNAFENVALQINGNAELLYNAIRGLLEAREFWTGGFELGGATNQRLQNGDPIGSVDDQREGLFWGWLGIQRLRGKSHSEQFAYVFWFFLLLLLLFDDFLLFFEGLVGLDVEVEWGRNQKNLLLLLLKGLETLAVVNVLPGEVQKKQIEEQFHL